MAASNTQFKVENGLFVAGTANVSGNLRVEGDFYVSGNLTSALNVTGDLKPTVNNTLYLGSALMRWNLYANSADYTGTVSVLGDTTLNTATTYTLLPSSNNVGLGSTTRRWDFYANNIDALTATISSNSTLANVTVSNTLSVGLIVANQTYLSLGNTQLTVNTGSRIAILATGNSTVSNLALTNDTTSIAGNVAFKTDLFTVDATNNKLGLKTDLGSLSAAALATITGNLEFSTGNTGIRLSTSNAAVNASIMVVAPTTSNSRLTFATYDNSNSTVFDGGYNFNTVNSTVTNTLLSLNNYQAYVNVATTFASTITYGSKTLGNPTGTGNVVLQTAPSFQTSIDTSSAPFTAFGSATIFTLGYTGASGSSSTSISSGALSGAWTKTVNIGTGGTTGSTTAINIGSTVGTTTTINGDVNVGGLTTLTGAVIFSNTFRYGGVTLGTGVTGTGNLVLTTAPTFASYVNITGVANAASFNATSTTVGSTFANNVTITGVANAVTLNVTGTALSTFANNVTITGVANVSSALNVGANVVVGTGSYKVGNATSNSILTQSYIIVGNNTVGVVNAVTFNAGANVAVNTTVFAVGNSISNSILGQTYLNVGNSTVGTINAVTINAGTLSISGAVGYGNTSVNGYLNATSYGLFGGVVNATAFNATSTTAGSTFANNITVSGTANAITLNATGATLSTFANNVNIAGVANVASLNAGPGSFTANVNVTANINTYAVFVGANVTASMTDIRVGNTVGNTTISQGYITVGNTTVGTVNAASFNAVGAITSTFANNVTITGTANVSAALNVGADVNLSSSQLKVGNTVTNTIITNSTITVGNTTVGTVNAFAMNVKATITANNFSGNGALLTTIPGTALLNTAVTPGSYTTTNLTVDAQGRITAASSGTSGVTSFQTSLNGLTPSTATTGAVTLAGTLGISSGGTGQTTAAAAITALTGTQTSGRYLRSDGTNAALSAIQAADVPTLNQNTTGTASNITAYTINQNVGTGNSPSFVNATLSGKLLVGSGSITAPSVGFSADGATDTGIYWTADGYTNFTNNGVFSGYVGVGGNLLMVGNITAYGSATAPSDIRLKKNITKIDYALDKVLQLNGYTFDRTDREMPRQTGVIAQEVQKILPEAIVELDDENKTLTVAYGNMMGLMIEAIKELNAKVEDLQNQLANK